MSVFPRDVFSFFFVCFLLLLFCFVLLVFVLIVIVVVSFYSNYQNNNSFSVIDNSTGSRGIGFSKDEVIPLVYPTCLYVCSVIASLHECFSCCVCVCLCSCFLFFLLCPCLGIALFLFGFLCVCESDREWY